MASFSDVVFGRVRLPKVVSYEPVAKQDGRYWTGMVRTIYANGEVTEAMAVEYAPSREYALNEARRYLAR